jgi:hypothetical protein
VFSANEVVGYARKRDGALSQKVVVAELRGMAEAPQPGAVYPDLLMRDDGRYVLYPHPELNKFRYFEKALGYHVAARVATFDQLGEVVGNLAHQAVELYLKGFLVDYMDERARKDLLHSLAEAWDVFKLHAPGDMSRFDAAIAALDPFEGIRYPDTIGKTGKVLQVARKRAHLVANTSDKEPSYEFALDDVDSLAEAILGVADVVPARLLERLSASAREHLLFENETTIWIVKAPA